MRLLSIDLETGQGFDVDDPVNPDNFITEFGAVLWDWEAGVPLEIMSTFVNEEKPQSKDCLEYTGITQAQIDEFGVPLIKALDNFLMLQEKADYLVAHNGTNFDIPLIELALKRVGLKSRLKHAIDTRIDIRYPKHIKQRSLIYLAAMHGFVNPFPHRAAMDALTTLKVMSFYDLDNTLKVSLSEPVKLKAQFTYPRENRLGTDLFHKRMKEFNAVKDAIKNLGFTWYPDTKSWILESKAELIKDMDFPCPVVRL